MSVRRRTDARGHEGLGDRLPQGFTLLEAVVALGLTGVLAMGGLAVMSSSKSLDEANKSDADLSDFYNQVVGVVSSPVKCALALGGQTVVSTGISDVTLYAPDGTGRVMASASPATLFGKWKVTSLKAQPSSLGGAYTRDPNADTNATSSNAFGITLDLWVTRVPGPAPIIGSATRERTLRMVLQTNKGNQVTGCGLSDPYTTSAIPLPSCSPGYNVGFQAAGYWQCTSPEGYAQ